MADPRRDLAQRISEFRPQLRLGLDIGQWAGGIAVIQRNEIKHAETYTDYHVTTLKDRRTLRRGRRTRHAKKMRLARLRSWILRQEVEGQRLPDPYQVMRQKKYQCQPGEFAVGRKGLSRAGLEKPALGSWVQAVKAGSRADLEAFIIALTQLFQKRGFRWEGSDLAEMTDEELKEELSTVRLTEEAAQQIRAELERRARNPREGYEGKIKDAESLIKEAIERKKQPRTPEHRSVVADDLKALVQAFCRVQCPGNAEEWTRCLVRLLNKPIRQARFENRVVSGCSLCGQKTPRKARPKVREIAYRAAVMNLRVEELNAKRPLTAGQRKYFEELWTVRESARKTKDSIKKHLTDLPSQQDMATQLWELLYAEQPKGRTNLCVHHLELQAQGAFPCNLHRAVCRAREDNSHEQIEKLERTGPAVRASRNPCREQHDERLIRRIEFILFAGKRRPKFGSAPSLITIEFPRPHTAQSYPCPYCAEKLAVDLRVRYKVKSLTLLKKKPEHQVLQFSCPFCHGDLTLKGTRQITIKGRARKIPVTLKNTDAFVRKAKGGLKHKKKLMLLSETRNACIYCDRTLDLSTMEVDHIFPSSRGGPGIDSNLVTACHACNHPDTGKGGRTPWQWPRMNQEWERFREKVGTLPLPLRKRSILLSKEELFPENPSALARAGARPRQFIEALKDMLERNGVPRERIADNFEHGKIVIQTIDGWMTTRLRKSWQTQSDGSRNFPPKKDWDLYNHAQDAALIAACPPHTWRERVFSFGEYEDLAPQELAPDWAAFMDDREAPIVRVLGKYPISWKRNFADDKFCQNPHDLNETRNYRYIPLKEFTYSGTQAKGKGGKRHPSVTHMVNEDLDAKFRSVARSVGLRDKQSLGPEDLKNHFPGIRHVKASIQKGGELARVLPKDGPPRKVQLKKASEAVVFWKKKGAPLNDLRWSIQWPEIFQRFGVPRHHPTLDDDAEKLQTWERHKMIWLDQETGHSPGFYRVKEFDEGKVTVLPENAVTKDLADRMGLKTSRGEKESTGSSPEEEGSQEQAMGEVFLGKKDLVEYFKAATRGSRAAKV